MRLSAGNLPGSAEVGVDAWALGFDHIAAGPLVRSSYHAEQTLAQASAQ